MKALKIDTVDVFLAKQFFAGKITLRQVAEEFYRCGWTNFINEDYAQRKMNDYEQRRKI